MYLLKDVSVLKDYGFIKEPQNCSYDLRLEQYNIFIWNRKNDIDYEYKRVYIEFKDHNIVIDDLYILYQLIIDGVIGYD